MFDKRHEEMEDRQKLRQCMKYLLDTYGKREPTEIADSLCRIYEDLYNLNGRFNIFLLMMFNNLFAVCGSAIFVSLTRYPFTQSGFISL